MSNDRSGQLIRWSTVAAVALVAGIAGWASYTHAVEVVSAHGESGMVVRVYPATVDGLIFAASMVLLDSARRKIDAPALAYLLLAAGIAATLAANLTAGIRFGWLGAVVAAWPAPALVGSYELLMWLVRTAAVPEPSTAAFAQPGRSAIAKAAPAAAAGPVLVGPAAAATGAAPVSISAGHRRQAKGKRKRQLTTMSRADQEATISALLQSEPNLSRGELARRTGLSPRTVGRALQRISDPLAHGLT